MPTVRPLQNTADCLVLPAEVNVNRIQWNYVLSFAVMHALAMLAFMPYFFSWQGVIAFWAGVVVFGQIGIPVCYHRQLTHRSFKTRSG
jgi:fatty-acid desaturase